MLPMYVDMNVRTVDTIQDRSLTKLIQQAGVPGIALAVLKNGRVDYRVAGWRDVAEQLPVEETTVFSVASLSKPVFAHAVLQLVEKNRLNLDKPIFDYLQELGVGKLDHLIEQNLRFKSVTPRHVLSQMSGLPNWSEWNTNQWDIRNARPGKKITYSGPAFFALGLIIERISNVELNTVMREELFAPLEMFSSSYQWEHPFELNHAKPYNQEGRQYSINYERKCDVSGSLHSTIVDYSRFAAMLLHYYHRRKKNSVFAVQNKFKSLYEGMFSDGWGLGLPVVKTPFGPKYWHWGEDCGYQSYMELYPEEEMGFVYFTNSDSGLSINSQLASLVYQRKINKCNSFTRMLFEKWGITLPRFIVQ